MLLWTYKTSTNTGQQGASSSNRRESWVSQRKSQNSRLELWLWTPCSFHPLPDPRQFNGTCNFRKEPTWMRKCWKEVMSLKMACRAVFHPFRLSKPASKTLSPSSREKPCTEALELISRVKGTRGRSQLSSVGPGKDTALGLCPAWDLGSLIAARGLIDATCWRTWPLDSQASHMLEDQPVTICKEEGPSSLPTKNYHQKKKRNLEATNLGILLEHMDAFLTYLSFLFLFFFFWWYLLKF